MLRHSSRCLVYTFVLSQVRKDLSLSLSLSLSSPSSCHFFVEKVCSTVAKKGKGERYPLSFKGFMLWIATTTAKIPRVVILLEILAFLYDSRDTVSCTVIMYYQAIIFNILQIYKICIRKYTFPSQEKLNFVDYQTFVWNWKCDCRIKFTTWPECGPLFGVLRKNNHFLFLLFQLLVWLMRNFADYILAAISSAFKGGEWSAKVQKN